jgi:hypothetical protein
MYTHWNDQANTPFILAKKDKLLHMIAPKEPVGMEHERLCTIFTLKNNSRVTWETDRCDSSVT